MFRCECRVAWQTNGATPLFIANQYGRVECVRALLDGGAAINQAMVGSTSSIARHCGGCVRGSVWEPAHTHAFAAGWVRWGGTRWGDGARGDGAHAVLQVMGSIAMMGCSRCVNAVVRPGMRA
jgi:hypothetical protein